MNCKTCFCDLNTATSFISLSMKDTNCNLTLMDKLIQCVPEMNVVGTNEDYVCPSCYVLLLSAYNFRTMCLERGVKFLKRPASRKEAVNQTRLSDDELIEKACSEISELNGDRNKINCRVALNLLPEKVIALTKRKESVFICVYCNTIFQSKKNFLVHASEHFRNVGGFREYVEVKCKECNISFRSIKIFEMHMKLHPQQYGIYTLGDERFASSDHTKIDELNITWKEGVQEENKVFKREPVEVNTSSSILQIKFDGINNSNKKTEIEDSANTAQKAIFPELNLSTPNEMFYCSVCNKNFFSHYKLTRHLATQIHMRKKKCPFCCKIFTSAVSAQRHYSTHSEINNNCSNCNQYFPSVRKLGMHLVDTGCCDKHRYRINCIICKLKFSSRKQLMVHLCEAHNNILFPIQCETCLVSFESITSVCEHRCKPSYFNQKDDANGGQVIHRATAMNSPSLENSIHQSEVQVEDNIYKTVVESTTMVRDIPNCTSTTQNHKAEDIGNAYTAIDKLLEATQSTEISMNLMVHKKEINEYKNYHSTAQQSFPDSILELHTKMEI